ncbi:MAG: DUF4198 domain-containing protein [Rhizobacter sp.]|jgi:hypothetical protein
MLKTLLALSATMMATTAFAHQLWIEQAPGQPAMVRFGEYAHNLRETSPGLLDRFGQTTGMLVRREGDSPLQATKEAGGFRLTAGTGEPVSAGSAESLLAEDLRYPLYKSRQGETDIQSWYRPAARLVSDFAAQAPRLALDIVPTGREGEFRLTYNGQPLPKTKVTIAVQSGWAQETMTDAHGQVRFPMPWQGLYVLEASHMDRTPGERPGTTVNGGTGAPERFDRRHHVTTLSVLKADGLTPLPAAPTVSPGH